MAWFYVTGEWPVKEVDHINRVKNDDRWENLRQATSSQNATNKLYRQKKSGLPHGVVKHGSKFQAVICVNYKMTWLGTFSTPEEAHQAYLKASEFRKEYLPREVT